MSREEDEREDGHLQGNKPLQITLTVQDLSSLAASRTASASPFSRPATLLSSVRTTPPGYSDWEVASLLVNDPEDFVFEKLVPGGSTKRRRHTRSHANAETEFIVQ